MTSLDFSEPRKIVSIYDYFKLENPSFNKKSFYSKESASKYAPRFVVSVS